jgi:hypothetical protein
MNVNWIAAFNRLFVLLNREGATYCGGPNFLRMVQQVDPGSPSYQQLLQIRQQQGKSTSRKDYYWDMLQELSEPHKYQLFRLFIDELESHARDEVEAIKAIVFGGSHAVPTTVVPMDLWNSEKLNSSLKDIDSAIDSQQYNRATTLAYTCLEGLYKTYIYKHVPARSELTDLIQLCKVVKDDITEKLKSEGAFPQQIVNTIPTLTNAVANSRNGFSEAHFAGDAQKWLALFARDLTNSIGRLLLHFM